LKRLFVSNEWLNALHRRQWTENRLVPLGLTFKAGKQMDLDLFYMVVSSHRPTGWQQESIIGTFLRIQL